MTSRTRHFDVAVIGAGPAGIAAAVTADAAGLSVCLIDDSPLRGGQIWRHIDGAAAPRDAQSWLSRLDASAVTPFRGMAVADAVRQPDGWSLMSVRASLASNATTISARRVIIASGARERFVPFPGWTLPGVMGVGGAQALLKSGMSVRGRSAVIGGTGPLMLPVAAALAKAGTRVTHVLDQADRGNVFRFAASLWRTPERLAQAIEYRIQSGFARHRQGWWVASAHGTDRVTAVTITNGRTQERISCDMLCSGYGLVPSTELASLFGCAVANGVVSVDASQRTSVEDVFAAGEVTGVGGAEKAIAEGELAALAAAAALDHTTTSAHKDAVIRLQQAIQQHRDFVRLLDEAFRLRPEIRALAEDDTIVCRCEDVTAGEVRRCSSMREARLHTRTGMGPCQGRVCGPALQTLFGWSDTSIRPPIIPVPVSALIHHDPAEREETDNAEE